MRYKFIKKIVEAFGFKLIDKNIIKNERLISKHSFVSVDKVLKNLFLNNDVKFLVQIGANDGQRFDTINKFIKNFNPSVIFVEPIKSNFDNLKKFYSNQKNLFYENVAISVNNEINELYKVNENYLHLYDEHIVGITSFDKNHLIKHGVKNKHIVKENVKTISITSLLKKYSIQNFDLLLIDTEGYDSLIVKDFLINTKIRPIIIFEYIHSKKEYFSEAIKILISNKYVLFRINENVICFPENKKNKINFI
ncbi:FkbM family methyltransferase [Pelagibacterales bacterium SAG-MED01]|nr:FkbM family methyltransferase [Pelagibacterales bacterium SAG-MED01]